MEVNGGVWLPEDVIFAVLSWLPVKPLCRFRCVSTAWRAIISSPAFAAAQRSHAAPLLVGAFAAAPPDDEPGKKRHCPPGSNVRKTPGHELRVMDADGNVLMVLRGVMGGYDKLLTTRLDLLCVDKWSDGASVVDPASRRVATVGGYRRRPVSCSFGRAAASGAYKVLRLYDKLLCVSPIRFHFCEVATLGDGGDEEAWRPRATPPFRTCSCASCTVAVNGVVYFLPIGACTRPSWNRCIACFDLESEEWEKKMIEAPKLRFFKPLERRNIALGELKGALCMVETVKSDLLDDMYTNVDIWVLVDCERSIWVKEYSIQSPESLFTVKPLEVLRDGRLLLLKTIEKAQGEPEASILQRYEPSTGTFTDQKQMSKEFKGMMTLHTESILSQL